jgi:hypothetical protein
MYVCMYIYVCMYVCMYDYLHSVVFVVQDGLRSPPPGCSSAEPFLRSIGYEPNVYVCMDMNLMCMYVCMYV